MVAVLADVCCGSSWQWLLSVGGCGGSRAMIKSHYDVSKGIVEATDRSRRYLTLGQQENATKYNILNHYTVQGLANWLRSLL